MHNRRRVYKRRHLQVGGSLIDTIRRFGSNGFQQVRTGVTNGIRHYAPIALRFGVKQVADAGRNLVDNLQDSANSKIRSVLGSGISTVGRPAGRSMILREIRHSLAGNRKIV